MWNNPLTYAIIAGILVYLWCWYKSKNEQTENDNNKFVIPIAVAVITYFGVKWYCCNHGGSDTLAYGSESPVEISIVDLK
jgi:hypothetical protein